MIKRIQSEKGGSRSLWTLFAIHYVTNSSFTNKSNYKCCLVLFVFKKFPLFYLLTFFPQIKYFSTHDSLHSWLAWFKATNSSYKRFSETSVEKK